MSRLVLAASVLLGVLCAAPADVRADDTVRFALLVSHDDGGPGTDRLFYADSDAERLADVLAQLAGVSRDHTFLLRSPTVAGFERALAAVSEAVARAEAAGAHTQVLFYYSGHADPDALRLGRETLAFTALRAGLEATGADARLLFLDSCFSGGASRAKGAARAPGFLREASASVGARGEVVITSSAADEASQESDEVGGSYFTHYLISGLRGAADASGDGAVTLDEAYRYVYHRTVAHTTGTRSGTQHPGFDYDLSGSGDLVLTELGTRGAALSFGADDDGRYLIFDDDDRRFVAEVRVTPGRPARLLVDAGRYRVQRRGDDALHEQVVALRTGDEHAVERSALRAVPYADDVTKGHIATYRRLRAGRGLVIAPKVGAQVFFDPDTRAELVPPSPLFGAELDLRGFPGPWASLRADVLVGVARHKPLLGGTPTDILFTEVHAGVGPFLTPRIPGTRVVRPFLGLRVGVLWLHREFLPPLLQPAQDYVMVTPGVAGGVEFALSDRVSLAIEGRVHLMMYVVDGEQQAEGYVEPLASLRVAL